MQKIINNYLYKFGHAKKINEFNNNYFSHPNFPSLLAIVDSLTQLEIENVAANVPFDQIENLPNSFIAELVIDDKNDFYIIEKTEGRFYAYNDNLKKNKYQFEEIESFWTGLVILVEENTNKNLVDEKSQYYIYFLLFIIGLYPIIAEDEIIYSVLQLFLTIIGLILSVEIIKELFNKDDLTNKSKFCNKDKDFSCSEIIKSNVTIYKNYLTFVDLPILFFLFSLLLQILFPNLVVIIGFFSLFSIPVIIYSIYYQRYIAQKWCMLCLSISLVLSFNTVLFFLNFKITRIENIDVFNILILLMLVYLLWHSVKTVVLKKISLKKQINGLLRFKRSKEVFEKVSKKIQYDFIELNLIKLGNEKANNTIVLFLSPSCPYCHIVFAEALEIIEKFSDMYNLKIGFNVNVQNNENPFIDVALIVQKLYLLEKDYKKALADWHIKKLEIADWKIKWDVDDLLSSTTENEDLQSQYNWCLKNELHYAPIRIFNNYLLNENYELKDVFYFIEE